MRFHIAQQNRRPRAQFVFRERVFDMFARFHELRAKQRILSLLAEIMRDLLEVWPLRERFHPPRDSNRFRPILFLLVDLQQKALRLKFEWAAVELGE